MTTTEFADAIQILCQRFGGSVTSWGRTVAHNKMVGGVSGSAHTWFLGADVVWDAQPSGFALAVRQAAYDLGLWVLWEGDHTHFQPLDWHNKERPA